MRFYSLIHESEILSTIQFIPADRTGSLTYTSCKYTTTFKYCVEIRWSTLVAAHSQCPKPGKSAPACGTGPIPPTGARGGKGQHFLRNMSVVQRIVDKAAIKNTDTVLEIGPGTGIMTVCMLEKAKRVICVELDPRMIAETLKQVQGTEYASHLRIIQGGRYQGSAPVL